MDAQSFMVYTIEFFINYQQVYSAQESHSNDFEC